MKKLQLKKGKDNSKELLRWITAFSASAQKEREEFKRQWEKLQKILPTLTLEDHKKIKGNYAKFLRQM